jgi:D-alanyl-D-alanine dipeptidase
MAPAPPDGGALTRLAPSEEGGVVFAEPAYHRRGLPGALPDIWLRPEVAARVRDGARALESHGLGLLVLDGWRPRALQAALWEQYRSELARQTGLEGAALDERTRAFVSPPGGSDPPPAHSTGAAVDLTLCTRDGEPLDMGGAFDELSAHSHPDHYERDPVPDEARLYRDRRRLLAEAMASAGFWRLPTEWWHFEYGTAGWASETGAEALFGEVHVQPD